MLIDNNAMAFIPNNKLLDNTFAFHFLNSIDLYRYTSKTSVPSLRKSDLQSIKIPLPPLPEQRRIAAILDKADALRQKRQQAIVKLDELLQSVFLEMFGDPVTNPKGWPVHSITDLSTTKLSNGVFRKNKDYEGSGVPVVWLGELFKGREIYVENSRRLEATTKEIESCGLKHGDLLFCRSSLKLDGIAYNNVYLGESDKALFECHLIRVRLDQHKILPEFANQLLRCENVRSRTKLLAKTATMSTIDQKAIGSIPLLCPPLDIQRRFVELIKVLESKERISFKSLTETRDLFASLQQRAFNGTL